MQSYIFNFVKLFNNIKTTSMTVVGRAKLYFNKYE